jgi:hypothetical protein
MCRAALKWSDDARYHGLFTVQRRSGTVALRSNTYLMDIDPLLKTQAWATIAATVVGAITLGVLIWYTVETYRLRRTAQLQLTVPMMPIVLLRLELGLALPSSDITKDQSFILAVRNVGFGTAFNVQIEPRSKDGIVVGFDRLPFLEPGVEKPVECQVEEEGKRSIARSLHRLKSLIQNDKFDTDSDLIINYLGAFGTTYRSIHKLEPDDFMLKLETVYQGHQEVRVRPGR